MAGAWARPPRRGTWRLTCGSHTGRGRCSRAAPAAAPRPCRHPPRCSPAPAHRRPAAPAASWPQPRLCRGEPPGCAATPPRRVCREPAPGPGAGRSLRSVRAVSSPHRERYGAMQKRLWLLQLLRLYRRRSASVSTSNPSKASHSLNGRTRSNHISES